MARPRDDTVDRRIMDATRELLGENGYEGLTMTAAAERAGVGKPTLYRRFRNRDDLIFALSVDDAHPPGPIDTGSFEGDVRAACQALVGTLTPSSRALFGPQVGRAITDEQAGALFLERLAGNSDGYMRPIWARGVAAGRVDPALDYEVARTALGTSIIFSVLLYRLDTSCVDQIVDMWLAGVRPVAPPRTPSEQGGGPDGQTS